MANPPITIGPFSNVPAPGSAIQSAWAQQLTQAHVDYTTRPVEWKRQAISFTSQTYTTTSAAAVNMPLVARAWQRLIFVDLRMFLTRSAGDTAVDVFLTCSGAVGLSSTAHRVRQDFTQSVSMTATFLVAATAAPAVGVSLGAPSASVTVATLGSTDMNSLSVYAVPINTYVGI